MEAIKEGALADEPAMGPWFVNKNISVQSENFLKLLPRLTDNQNEGQGTGITGSRPILNAGR